MRRRWCIAAVAGLAFASGCFQEKAPRLEPPANAALANAGQRLTVTERAGAKDEAPRKAVEALAGAIRDAEVPAVRREAVYALADTGAADDASVIGEALTDPEAEVRLAAIEALTGIGGEASANWLSVGLGDPDPGVRRTAVEALGEIRGESAKILLQQSLQDADEDVREAAQQILAEPEFAESGIR